MGKNLKKQKQFRFSDSELALLERGKAKHGSYTAAVVAGLKMLDGQNSTDWPAELRRLAKELESG